MKYEKVKAGEIWIRFESMKEYENNSTKMKDCMFKSTDERFNTCKVIVYISENQSTQKRCDHFMYESLEALRDELGEANVVFANERTVNICDREFKDSENVERIADALVGIRMCLEKITERYGYPELQQFDNLKRTGQQEISG